MAVGWGQSRWQDMRPRAAPVAAVLVHHAILGCLAINPGGFLPGTTRWTAAFWGKTSASTGRWIFFTKVRGVLPEASHGPLRLPPPFLAQDQLFSPVPCRLPIMPYFITLAALGGSNCTWSPPAAWARRGPIPCACLSSLHRFI
jgi:hypothetical protein